MKRVLTLLGAASLVAILPACVALPEHAYSYRQDVPIVYYPGTTIYTERYYSPGYYRIAPPVGQVHPHRHPPRFKHPPRHRPGMQPPTAQRPPHRHPNRPGVKPGSNRPPSAGRPSDRHKHQAGRPGNPSRPQAGSRPGRRPS